MIICYLFQKEAHNYVSYEKSLVYLPNLKVVENITFNVRGKSKNQTLSLFLFHKYDYLFWLWVGQSPPPEGYMFVIFLYLLRTQHYASVNLVSQVIVL